MIDSMTALHYMLKCAEGTTILVHCCLMNPINYFTFNFNNSSHV